VEVALDAPAGFVGGRDDARAGLPELDPRIDVGDGLRDQLGERPEARLRVGAERVTFGTCRERTPRTAVHENRRGDGRAHPARPHLLGEAPRQVFLSCVDRPIVHRMIVPRTRLRGFPGHVA
jgi:hypothetical protein